MILLKQGLVIFAAFSIVAQSWWSNSSDQEKEDASPEYEKGWEFVTWGSTIQLRHLATKTRLTVPQVNYGSGSGQLAVTSKADSSDTQNFWMVSPENGIAFMGRKPVKCGSIIRLLNTDSNHYLHSHKEKSPLSSNQEVSVYQSLDSGDNWILKCTKPNAKYWERDAPVQFVHKDTDTYLTSSANRIYPRPISGHHEVSATKKPNSETQWAAWEGFYFKHTLSGNY